MTGENRDRRPPEEGGAKRPDAAAGGPSASTFAGLGLQLLVAILVFLYAGQWLDRRFATKGIFTVVGVLVGAGAAIFSAYRKLVAEQARSDAERQGRTP